jgi:hypothetical protein
LSSSYHWAAHKPSASGCRLLTVERSGVTTAGEKTEKVGSMKGDHLLMKKDECREEVKKGNKQCDQVKTSKKGA